MNRDQFHGHEQSFKNSFRRSWRRRISPVMFIFAFAVIPASGMAQTPLDQTFTYQGQLKQGGSLADGVFDFEFNLYNDPDPIVGSLATITKTEVSVADGLFVVDLNFGEVFHGEKLWLETGVRSTGSGPITYLFPLQPLSATPYSLYTLRSAESDNADTIDGFDSGDFLLSTGGSLAGSLDVSGTVAASAFDLNGEIITSWPTGGTSLWSSGSGGDIYYDGGDVGIGTDTPSATLAVAGNDGVVFSGTFGNGSLPLEGAGTRFLWYPRKGALRAGYVDSTEWDDSNIGNTSIALGASTVASGLSCTALGNSTTATGNFSTAMGYNTTASGGSTAMGQGSSASGFSTAMGTGTTATGAISTAMGHSTAATGESSTAMGYSTTASGVWATAMGVGTIATGNGATSLGVSTTAQSYGSVAMGKYNIAFGEPNYWQDTDPVFVIGNGTSPSSPSNAFVVFKNGNVQADGAICDMNGCIGSGGGMSLWSSGSGGVILSDAGNVGIGTDAPGASLAVAGTVSMGTNTDPMGPYTVTMGDSTSATGNASIAMGFGSMTTGDYSTAMGYLTLAQAYGSLVIGRHNVVAGSQASWNPSDPVFVVGNGESAFNPSNALTVLKSGKLGVANSGPAGTFEVGEGGDGTAAWANFWLTFSDRRYTENVRPIENASELIDGIEGVYFDWLKTGEQSIGFIAQDVEDVLPEVVRTNDNGYKAVDYGRLTPVLLEVVKHQKRAIRNLEERIAELESRLRD
ncbi:MAG: hypothetical protein GY835_10240 [bacterium]|nr:hypothetical protein [bacterium]